MPRFDLTSPSRNASMLSLFPTVESHGLGFEQLVAFNTVFSLSYLRRLRGIRAVIKVVLKNLASWE